jgi:hypothetical protein
MSDIPNLPEDVRISYTDLAMAWSVVADTDYQGKGAISRHARHRSVPVDRVKAALDRVEAAFGGRSFLEKAVKRKGAVTPAGHAFLDEGYKLQKAWYALAMTLEAPLREGGGEERE